MTAATRAAGTSPVAARWRELPETDAVSAYLLTFRLDRWEAEHAGWLVEWHPIFGYWEALRQRGAETVALCRASVDELFARVEEFLAGEAAALRMRP